MKNRENGVPVPTKGYAGGRSLPGQALVVKPEAAPANPDWRSGSTNAPQGPQNLVVPEQQTTTGLPGRSRRMAQMLQNPGGYQTMALPPPTTPYVPYRTSPLTSGGLPNYSGIGQLPPGFIPKPSPI